MQELILTSIIFFTLGAVLGYIYGKHKFYRPQSNLLEVENLMLKEKLHEHETKLSWIENLDNERTACPKRRLSDRILAETEENELWDKLRTSTLATSETK